MSGKLLTLFSCPKPFTNPHIVTIQRNAIRSWACLGAQVEVILLGNDAGVAETAAEFGVRHIPAVACTEQGTPLISSLFGLARQNSDAALMVYVNADILLTSDLITAAQAVSAREAKFLMVGQRWDLEVRTELEFPDGWEKVIRARVQREGGLHSIMGIDCFVYPRDCFTDVPAFAIGRAGWDNWMIYKAHHEKWKVIDMTPSVMVVHQDHDYSHLPNQTYYGHPETVENIRLAGGKVNTHFTLLDADRRLVRNRIRPVRLTLFRLMRRMEVLLLRFNPAEKTFIKKVHDTIYLNRVKWQEKGG